LANLKTQKYKEVLVLIFHIDYLNKQPATDFKIYISKLEKNI